MCHLRVSSRVKYGIWRYSTALLKFSLTAVFVIERLLLQALASFPCLDLKILRSERAVLVHETSALRARLLQNFTESGPPDFKC
jgi:hypothetical protein